jgi:hypothetical protein
MGRLIFKKVHNFIYLNIINQIVFFNMNNKIITKLAMYKHLVYSYFPKSLHYEIKIYLPIYNTEQMNYKEYNIFYYE